MYHHLLSDVFVATFHHPTSFFSIYLSSFHRRYPIAAQTLIFSGSVKI
jgi:hypothetical protein